MKKSIKYVGLVVITILLCQNFISCSSDDDDDSFVDETSIVVIVDENGNVSGGHSFVDVDGKHFFIDEVEYTVVGSHLEVTGFDKQLPTKVVIPAIVRYKGSDLAVKVIKKDAFYKCFTPFHLVVPNTVVTIESAFYNSNLQSIVIPGSVTTIGGFSGCSSLLDITNLSEVPQNIYDYTIYNYEATLHVKKGCAEAYKKASGWSKFKNIVEDA